ncbi:MAG TPA: CsbD family protein [Dongiaceae bacterium]|nr:CsbD family protein [Dongiaceae bacterium]
MKLSTRYQIKGAFRVVKGSAKALTGKISSNRWLGVKGRLESFAGRVQLKIGKAQGLVGL